MAWNNVTRNFLINIHVKTWSGKSRQDSKNKNKGYFIKVKSEMILKKLVKTWGYNRSGQEQ